MRYPLRQEPATNWALGWHQDRTIAVCDRREVSGYGTWTTKAGMQHVEPPVGRLARMVTLRLHLDPVDADNAPLLFAPGSHSLGRIAEGRSGRWWSAWALPRVWPNVVTCGYTRRWWFTPPTRRSVPAVLQVDYSPDELPGGLEWLGV